MKISTNKNYINIENPTNTSKISDRYIEISNRIFEIINKKISKINKINNTNNTNNTNLNTYDYINLKTLEKIDDLEKINLSKIEKLKKIFIYIYCYYISIAGDFEQEGIKISIPNLFRQILEDSDILNNIEIIICGDNPGNQEYEKDRGFNPDAKAGGILKNILVANGILDENILFFNKTFISTCVTKELNKIKNKKLVKNTIEFNSKILNILSKILNKPILVLGGKNEKIFDIFFQNLNQNANLAPHTSMYKIFGKNKNIEGWNEKFEAFKKKYIGIDIFTKKGNVSFKKINNLEKNKKNQILKEYFQNVIINN